MIMTIIITIIIIIIKCKSFLVKRHIFIKMRTSTIFRDC